MNKDNPLYHEKKPYIFILFISVGYLFNPFTHLKGTLYESVIVFNGLTIKKKTVDLSREKIADFHPRYMNRVHMNEDNPHYHEEKTYIFNHRCRLEEGVNQALWLTKSKLMGEGQVKMTGELPFGLQHVRLLPT